MQEPDGLTVVADDGKGKLIASTLVGEHDPAAGHEDVIARRWLVGLGLSKEQLLKLSFSTQVGVAIATNSSEWAAHWSAPQNAI
jgi:hypothetical protein